MVAPEPRLRTRESVYSDVGYALVGLAIERVTGERLAELMRAQILDPLGLDRVVWTPEERASAPRARPGSPGYQ